ncbi:haloacid dehalogenase-like hydrolase, partial [Enterobacter ludwigii]
CRYLEEMGEKWFRRKLESEFFIESAVSALKKHQNQNMYTVFISGSMLPILSPIAKYLGVTEVLCAPVIINDEGELT